MNAFFTYFYILYIFFIKLCYYFSIDASNEDSEGPKFGRLINHAPKNACNCKVKMISIEDIPKLAIFATKDIAPGAELCYNYGVENLPFDHKKNIKKEYADTLVCNKKNSSFLMSRDFNLSKNELGL